MNEKIFSVGIAGYGVVGKRRRKFIDMHPNLKTVAVCDKNFSSNGEMDDSVKFFSNHKDLLAEKLDVLFVCLPNYMAAEVTVAGLNDGLHVFCEKPPGRDIADIKKVIEAESKNKNLVLKYGFNHRYHGSVKEALRVIQSKELGEVVHLRGVYGKSRMVPFSRGWRSERKYAGGGILLDQGIHMVDLICLFADKFTEVKSFVSNSYWNHDVEDNAFALMRDNKGRVAILHSSATQWQHRFHLEVTCTEGFLNLQGILSSSKSYGQEKLTVGRRTESDKGTLQEESLIYLEDNSWHDEVNEFADAIVNNTDVIHGTSEEALETMRIIYRIYYADLQWRKKYGIANPDQERLNV
jgi:predicted dehydrogenase